MKLLRARKRAVFIAQTIGWLLLHELVLCLGCGGRTEQVNELCGHSAESRNAEVGIACSAICVLER
jgi:hypothetical protein